MPEKPEKKPNPELQNEVFVKEVRRLYYGVTYKEEKPALLPVAKGPIPPTEGAGTFYTFTYEGKQAVCEWRAKEGFYVTRTREKEFGKDAKCVIMNPYMAARRVAEILGSGEMVGLT